MTIETVVGLDAAIHFDADKCIHSRGCVLSHPDVFVPNVKGEWIHPDAQPVEELMHVANFTVLCAVKRRCLLAGANPARQLSLQPVAIGATVEVTKLLKPSM